MINDPLSYQLTQFTGTTTVTTLYFATVQVKNLTQSNYGLLLPSNYTFTYNTINRMPAGCTFLITYPSTVQPYALLTTCYVTYGGVNYTMSSCLVNTASASITITSGFNHAVVAGG